MTSIQEQVRYAEIKFKDLKAKLEETLTKIKEEIKSNANYLTLEDNFRFAIMLFFGSYSSKYSSLPNSISISRFKTWKENNYLDHYLLYRESYNSDFNSSTSKELKGFICYKKDLITAINEELLAKVWLFHIKNTRYRYTDSFADFQKSCKTNKLNLYEIFNEYLNEKREDDTLEIINCKQIKLNNIVLFIKK